MDAQPAAHLGLTSPTDTTARSSENSLPGTTCPPDETGRLPVETALRAVAGSQNTTQGGREIMRVRAKTFKNWMKANFSKEQLRDIAQHGADAGWGGLTRSEEHTSELQSRENLVC